MYKLLHAEIHIALHKVLRIKQHKNVATLQEEFSYMLDSVTSHEVQAIKQYSQTLKAKTTCVSGFFKKSPWSKAREIERALCDMPIVARGTVLSQDNNLVKTAISKSRTPGKKHSQGLFKVQRILENLRDHVDIEHHL